MTAALSTPVDDPPVRAVAAAEAFDRFCRRPDGDREATWTYAQNSGYRHITEQDIPNLRLPSQHGLRAFETEADGVRRRVLTASFMHVTPDHQTRWRMCWTSSTGVDQAAVEAELEALIGVEAFRMKDTRVMAWIPNGDGPPQPVSQRRFNQLSNRLGERDGMRFVTLHTSEEAGVMIGMFSPQSHVPSANPPR